MLGFIGSPFILFADHVPKRVIIGLRKCPVRAGNAVHVAVFLWRAWLAAHLLQAG